MQACVHGAKRAAFERVVPALVVFAFARVRVRTSIRSFSDVDASNLVGDDARDESLRARPSARGDGDASREMRPAADGARVHLRVRQSHLHEPRETFHQLPSGETVPRPAATTRTGIARGGRRQRCGVSSLLRVVSFLLRVVSFHLRVVRVLARALGVAKRDADAGDEDGKV